MVAQLAPTSIDLTNGWKVTLGLLRIDRNACATVLALHGPLQVVQVVSSDADTADAGWDWLVALNFLLVLEDF